MDQLHLITVFVAVVDAGGLAGAARKLGISPPAVTRAIKELESQLGVRLLTRTTRIVRVTEPGARYVEDCRRILAELAEANESVGGMHGAPRGRLTVTAPVLFGARFVTPIVTEYLQRYPDVSVSCWFLDRIVNMMDEGVDVAVRIGELPDSSMQAIHVGHVRRVICGAPGYLERHGVPQRPDDLRQHCIISASAVTPTSEWRLAQDGAPLHRQAAAAPDHHHATIPRWPPPSAASASPGSSRIRSPIICATGGSRPCSTTPIRRCFRCTSCTAKAGMPRTRPARFSTSRSSACGPAWRSAERPPAVAFHVEREKGGAVNGSGLFHDCAGNLIRQRRQERGATIAVL